MDPSAEPPKDLRQRAHEFVGALSNVPKVFEFLWEADRKSVLGCSLSVCIGAALPVSQAWTARLIIDSVLSSLHAHASAAEGFRAILPYLVLQFGLTLTGAVNGVLRQLVDKFMNHQLGHLVNRRIISKALSLEAKWFEDPQFYDKMQNARRQSEYRAFAIVSAGFLTIQNILTLLSFLVVLLAFKPSLAALLFAAAIPAFVAQCRYSQLAFRLETWRAPETRAMAYLEQLLTLDTSVKEIKLFSLGDKLLGRYSGIFTKIFGEDAALAKSRSVKSVGWGMLATLATFACNGWCIYQAVAGRITLGQMTLYIALFAQSQGVFQGMLDNINALYEHGLFMDNLFSFLGLESRVEVVNGRRTAEDPARGIEFRNVSFRYPGNEEWALKDFSLTVGPDEKLALVGPNGSGKTTLVKLLARLYEPTEGEILIRGVDLKELTSEEVHRRFGARVLGVEVFGIHGSFGAIEYLDDLSRLLKAAGDSGADTIAEGLPKKYETVLGRWFDSGHELSLGQWQKIALARAFMNGGEILVLDEPTASLDAEAEYEIFQRFRDLTDKRIAILVSHRFSTVRMADRIAVLKSGRLEELGSHEELVAKGGTYARLFALQAQGYR